MKKTILVGLFTFSSAFLSFIALIFWVTANRAEIIDFSIAHPLVIPLVIIVWRIIAVIIPPLPGGVISLAFIPVLGWFWAYLYGVTGAFVGAVIAFYIARRFREPVVEKFVPLQTLHKIEEKISGRTELLAFLGIRLTTGSIMDFVSYAAGLSKLSPKKFVLATLIALIPEAAWYYFGGVTYDSLLSGANIAAVLIALIAFVVIFYFIKRHSQSL